MTPLNIMIIDDSILIIRKIESIVTQMGHNIVCVAKTGDEAIELYDKHNPDLVTMDITMPGRLNGIEATQAICNKYKDANIIVVTSHGQENMVREALKSGAKGYILKPINEEILIKQIEKIFDLS